MWPKVDSNSTCPAERCEIFKTGENVIWQENKMIIAVFQQQMDVARCS